MSFAAAFPLILFAVTMTGTPGPNNVMLTAHGALHGYRRTLPAILGILVGGVTLFTLLALGLGGLFQRYPLLQTILSLASVVYLLYLAWKIGTAPPPEIDAVHRKQVPPWSFWQAAVFQFANPKVWVMGITLMSSFLPSTGWLILNAIGLALVMEAIAFPCISFWAGFGTVIARWLRSERDWRIFNAVMGLATAACAGFILLD
ncbi:MAG: LysE family translocator [Salinisphaera sp.]|nr:LysE family translocator [Salinisphaera sp.]